MHFAPLFRAHEPSRAWDQSPHNIDLYAKNSTVLRALLADASIPRSQGTQGFLPTGLIFRWILPNLQDCKLTYATLEEIQESADDTELVPLSVPATRTINTHVFHMGEPCERYDHFVWRTSFPFHGFLHGEVYTTLFFLDACADALETLRLYPSDSYSEFF